MAVRIGRRIWLTADSRAVEEGDPEAVTLLLGSADVASNQLMEHYGLERFLPQPQPSDDGINTPEGANDLVDQEPDTLEQAEAYAKELQGLEDKEQVGAEDKGVSVPAEIRRRTTRTGPAGTGTSKK